MYFSTIVEINKNSFFNVFGSFQQIMMKFIRCFLLTISGILLFSSNGESNDRNRAIIDTLRWGFNFRSGEAYKRANQAKHLDSTYYVGHLIEAYHYFDKAEEHTGLAKAVKPLRKAIRLYEKDFGETLEKWYTREDIWAEAGRGLLRQLDYYDLSNRLINCYISLEMPDSAYSATLRFKDANLVYDFQSYHWLAWLYFRTRIYDSDKYDFLKDSIEDNLKAAFEYTDSLELRYQKNVPYIRNEILGAVMQGSGFYNSFQNSFIQGPRGVIANTLGILYGYDFQPELAAKYFKQMRGDDNLAKTVNLGFTYHSNIDFRTAEDYFSKVPDRGSRSRGGHWQGYSTIYVYKGEPLEGAAKLQEDRDSHGYTIGYGWDNLCLARMFLYAGYIDECDISLTKADNFTEVHYNTSFREDQYRFMLKTLRLMQAIYEENAVKFENKNHWLSLDWWKQFPGLAYDKYTTLYQLANELALNPEREMVYYHIFHTESIVSFDELWFILKNYSNDYFKEVFRQFSRSDPRTNLDRYYNYFTGKLLIEEGNDEVAYDVLTAILSDDQLDKEYEKLLIARVHESCAMIANENGWQPQKTFHLNELYTNFPEIIPFSEVQMAFRLNISPELKTSENPAVQNALSQLQDTNIDWEPAATQNFPEITLNLGENNRLQYEVIINRETFTQGAVELNTPDAGKKLAYRLFKVLR